MPTRFKENIKVILLRRFFFEAEANIYAARLREAGIQSFISNGNSSTMLPFVGGGFLLHINESDGETAQEILESLDNNRLNNADQDHRDADHDDIAFEKAIFEREQRFNKLEGKSLLIGLMILALALMLCFASFKGFQFFRGHVELRPTSCISY